MRVDLAAPQLEVDAAQRLDRAERLADVGDLEDDVVGHDPDLGIGLPLGSACPPRRAAGAGVARWRAGQLGLAAFHVVVRGRSRRRCPW